MEPIDETTVGRTARSASIGWVLTSGLAAALLTLLATLLGLLYRMGWLSTFGVSEDLFFPTSSTELVYWGYVALLDFWALVAKEHLGRLLLLGAFTVAMLCVGIALGLAWNRYGPRTADVLNSKFTPLSFEVARLLGIAALYPVAIFYLATAFLLLPFPAYERGKSSAEQRIRQYEMEIAAGTRSCHVLDGPTGSIGKCPMVIAQTEHRVAFLDGNHVHVLPAEDIRINWKLPVRLREAATGAGDGQR